MLDSGNIYWHHQKANGARSRSISRDNTGMWEWERVIDYWCVLPPFYCLNSGENPEKRRNPSEKAEKGEVLASRKKNARKKAMALPKPTYSTVVQVMPLQQK